MDGGNQSDRLPPGWARAELEDICEINPGTDISHIPNDAQLTFIPMAAVAELKNTIDTGWVRPLAEVVKGYTRFQSGDVLFAKITPCMENGKIAIVPTLPFNVGFGSTEFHVLRPRRAVDPRYVFHFLSQQQFRSNARRAMTGAVGQQRVPKNFLRFSQIAVAPCAEQFRIATEIEEIFGEIEAGEQELERAREGLAAYRRAVLKAAATGELTRDWRQANLPHETGEDLLRIVLNKRRGSKGEPLPPDKNVPTLPRGWTWASVDQLTLFFGNGLSKRPQAQPPGEPILRISAVRPFAVNVADRRYYRHPLVDNVEMRAVRGDLLFTRYNGSKHLVGVCGLMRSDEPILYPDKIMRARPLLADEKLGEYLEIALNCGLSRSFINRNVKTTAGQQGIAGSAIRRCPIPLPPLSELHRIVEEVGNRFTEAEQLEEALDRLMVDAARTRQSVLGAAFSGQLVPQDDSDEPASALIERLRAKSDHSIGDVRQHRLAVASDRPSEDQKARA